jgi:glycosyltransferase involved in cell wall biosynthesis
VALFPLKTTFLAVIIPTKNRSQLLQTRSLPSVANQTRAPDLLVVIDDSSPHHRYATCEAVKNFRLQNPKLPAQLLRNQRASGASGAWNTGFYWLANYQTDKELIVALLDDDDEWEPTHLEKALCAVETKQADVVATGLLRIEREGILGKKQLPPEVLRASDFLVGNPHIQGSNLVIRLETLLSVGGFDEGLQSCTDRDLCLRLIELGTVKYHAVKEVTVKHHAEAGRARLSTPGSRAKHAGLDAFWRKYRDRMTAEQCRAFTERGERLFFWQPPSEGKVEAWFVVGIIADASDPKRVTALLDDLRFLAHKPSISSLDVIILENGPLSTNGPQLRDAIKIARSGGLRIWFIPLEKQQHDAAAGAFGDPFDRGQGRAGIATTRSMLQAYLYTLARRRPGAVAWILDDDKRLDTWLQPKNTERLVGTLLQLRTAGVDVALGVDTEAAPLPMLSTLRGELHDLKQNLYFLTGLAPESIVPDRTVENQNVWQRSHSPYYDLAQGDGRHLETPLWWVPRTPTETAIESFSFIATGAQYLLNGRPLFRPLPNPETKEAIPSTQRGGCTWILNIDVLADTPNLAANFDGDPCRRSDMLWALMVEQHFERHVMQVPLAVTHDRTLPQIGNPWIDLVRDIRGHALYLAMKELLQRCSDRTSLPPLTWTDEDKQFFEERFHFHLSNRINIFELSLARIRTLLTSISPLLRSTEGLSPWWVNEPKLTGEVSLLIKTLDSISELVAPTQSTVYLSALRATSTEPIRKFLHSLESKLRVWSNALENCAMLQASLDEERVVNAIAGISYVTGAQGEMCLVGCGYEGVVLTDKNQIYKWFDAWPLRKSPRQQIFVRELVGKLGRSISLPRLNLLDELGGHIVARYPYEPSEPYQGGKGPSLYRMLIECRELGLVFNNLHPKNLRVVGDRLLLIDIGADLVPWTHSGWVSMVRRAWLCWRWWFRSDLDKLMTRSLQEADLPELEGIQNLFMALDGSNAVEELRSELARRMLAIGSPTIVDYGCGKGDLVAQLASSGLRVVGYDPDVTLKPRWQEIERTTPNVTFGNADLLTQLKETHTRFDAVACSLVLCTIEDGPEYESALDDLRNLVTESGTVHVVVCNPLGTFGGSTPFKERPTNQEHDYDETFSWVGCSGLTRQQRRDVHRPLRTLERDLLRHGLRVKSRWQNRTTDLHRFEPASDFLLLELQPIAKTPSITLAIKTCTMDWRTLEEQVRHLVGQLEGPETFVERLLVVDAPRQQFTRAHDEANSTAFEEVLNRLVRFRLIDRLVRCPTERLELQALNNRWFGIETTTTHAQNGSPTTATLAMFEAVRTPWLLQVDSDLMVYRPEPRELSVVGLLEALESNKTSVTVSLSITAHNISKETSEGPYGPWRTEVRGSLFHLPRLLALLPLDNRDSNDGFVFPWHRALDEKIKTKRASSLRLADPKLGFIHPPNQRKAVRDEWMVVLDRCAAGQLPLNQVGQVDWSTPLEEWLTPSRAEPMVVIIQSHRIPPGRMSRALESLLQQKNQEWGAIVLDDGSSPITSDFFRVIGPTLGSRWTLINTPIRRGGMANLVWAVRHICTNPESIIVLLDGDDSLIGDRVLDVVNNAYHSGADLTVGSMLRTDKESSYRVSFDNPRNKRGGGAVWQHLRTFRKRLFDSVPDEAFRLDGRYIDVAQDWAFMLPMVELAQKPQAIEQLLYLYEPSGEGKHNQREWREGVISRIVAKPSLSSSAANQPKGANHE